ELFGAGQPLDASKYYIILPDALGHGKSSKPSDGLRTKFPQYDYADMVDAQHRLLAEGIGIRHLRVVMGNSMGGMQVWLWGGKRPTSSWTSGWRCPSPPTPTTSCTSGHRPATTMRRPACRASRRGCC